MNRTIAIIAAALALFCALPTAAQTTRAHSTHKKAHAKTHHKPAADTTPIVWVNTKTGVYHYQGERWYGNTEQGEYLHEDQATAEGDRATENGQ